MPGKEASPGVGRMSFMEVVRTTGKGQERSMAEHDSGLGKEKAVTRAFHSCVDKGFQEDKRRAVVANCGVLWQWKSQLEKIKVEVDWMLLHVIEGLELFGPGLSVTEEEERKGSKALPLG